MAEYIDKEALLRKVHELQGGSFSSGLIVEQIEKAPTADVVEVKHGKWEYEYIYNDNTYECSVCTEPWTLIAGKPNENNMYYCPNCGAKMDKE